MLELAKIMALLLKELMLCRTLGIFIFVQVYEVDFTPPFRRISIITELERQLGITFPPASTFASPGEYTMHSMHVCGLKDMHDN